VLRDAAQYAGQTIIVVGRSTGTDEGSWLDEDCGLKIEMEGRKYRPVISTAYVASEFAPAPAKPKDFRWERRALNAALERVKRTTRLEHKGQSWSAGFGRFECAPTHQIQLSGGRMATIVGYGHLNGAPAQLIASEDAWLRLKGK
jgi:hypothetical protein